MASLTLEQIGAIKRSIVLGRTLQEDHPEVTNLYCTGHSLVEITRELNITSEYNVSEKIAVSGIHHALIGHTGAFGIDAYEGTISIDNARTIGREHVVNTGKKLFLDKKGIHAQTSEERRELGLRWGKINGKFGGLKSYIERKGYHARTAEQRKADGCKSAIARGQVPWTNEETEFICQLSLKPEYQRGSLIKFKLIAEEVNKKYHKGNKIRSNRSVGTHFYAYKKSLEQKV